MNADFSNAGEEVILTLSVPKFNSIVPISHALASGSKRLAAGCLVFA